MPELICRHLHQLLWTLTATIPIAAGTMLYLNRQSILKSFLPAPMDVNDIIARYENDELGQLDDVTLDKAVDTLDYAHKHYFDGVDFSQMSLKDAYDAQGHQRQLRTIADGIRKLLLRRYGCDD